MTELLCPVRSCGAVLVRQERSLACPRGHAFDLAKSGYCNLLQPQDRRSNQAGDSKQAVAARRRSLDRGTGDSLRDLLIDVLSTRGLSPGAPSLDAGCGDGFFTSALTMALSLDAWGVDISTAAVDAAARRYPGVHWIVANADRRLPFADGAFQVITSITASKHADEFRRLLAPEGCLIVVVPGADDQAELREAALGAATKTDRAARSLEMFGEQFELVRSASSRASVVLDHDGLVDLFAGAYRGLRTRERERLEGIESLQVTLHHDVLVMRGK